MADQTPSKTFWPQQHLLPAAYLLWPMVSLLTNVLGWLFLNRFAPRNDFGLAALNFTLPVCFIAGLILLIRWSRFRYSDPFERFSKGLATCLLYILFFGIWTMMAYPLGRVSSDF
ncbi:MAG: hypothetical protein K0Q55_3101 [Verrucomicrobia bacterium]|jgi:hypothetical protein|nr:hypothetical protein [Verrucomicrobiota bacterium]